MAGKELVKRWLFGIGCSLAVAAALPAQSLPSYTSVNPVIQMRSGLATLPYFGPDRRWHVSVLTDYGSLIEYTERQDRQYILDAEVLSTRLLVARSVGPNRFLLAETSFNGSYAGFLDGFLEWYHNFTGLRVAARDLRPKNAFLYRIQLPDRQFEYSRSSGWIGDVRVGAGARHGQGWQTTVWLTLPSGSGPPGYRKGVVSLNLTSMVHRDFGKRQRFTYEGTFGLGYTPRTGALSPWQRTTFFLVAQGLRARIVGPFHGYANLIYDSAYYRDTGIPELDRRELTLDAGALFRFKRGPTWLLGLIEDPASGPAIDVAFRIGAYW